MEGEWGYIRGNMVWHYTNEWIWHGWMDGWMNGRIGERED
jgi:hypothetical protein